MQGPIRIAVASGKGGTGKTTIATNLAVALADAGIEVAYVDCDVEEPNGHIFIKPEIARTTAVSTLVPEVDENRCTHCNACSRACRYSAILALGEHIVTFPKHCHGCGGCSLACLEKAIQEAPRITGVVEEGAAGKVMFLHGKLEVGEAMAPPIIRAVLDAAPRDRTLILDAPPGTSCPVIESVKTADVVLLVTEPTPFGLNDLKLTVEMVRELGVPLGVAVNRVGTGDNAVLDYCRKERISVLLEIPNERMIAEAYSRGVLAINVLPALKPYFVALYDKLVALGRTEKMSRASGRTATYVESSRADPLPSDMARTGERNDLRELVVVSGKGGTGKTSLVASFFALAGRAAVADCDVDVADLRLVLGPGIRQRRPFSAGKIATIDLERCNDCGACLGLCRFGAIRATNQGITRGYEIDSISCEGCGVCVDNCPAKAIDMVPVVNGEWFISDTRHGPMVHARLGIAQENSGKLVSLVRREAKAVAHLEGRELLICDGSPGIGCPVIASVAGADMALVVTEPTLSGLHDFQRVAELCRQFDIKTGVCINKADINPEVVSRIEADAARRGVPMLGRIRYDDSVTAAQVQQLAVVEHGDGPAARDIQELWERVQAEFEKHQR